MANTLEGKFDAQGLRVAIVASRFNDFITTRLVTGATDALKRHGVADKDLTVIWVPGAWEIPLALAGAARTNQYDALVAVGAVIRGGTPHFEHVSSEAIKGASAVMTQMRIPVGLGILTTDTIEQAIERAGIKAGNKGFEAAVAAIETANLMKQLREA